MTSSKRLQDQIEELFSDISVPLPQGEGKLPPTAIHENASSAAEALPEPATARPVQPPEPDGGQPDIAADQHGSGFQAEQIALPPEPALTAGPGVFARAWADLKSRLGLKLILGFFAAAAIPSLIIAGMSTLLGVSRIRSQVNNNLELLATLQENQIEQWIHSQTATIASMAREPDLEAEFHSFLTVIPSTDDEQTLRLSIHSRFNSFQVQHPEFQSVFLLDQAGQVLISTDDSYRGSFGNDTLYFTQGLHDSYYGPPALVEQANGLYMIVAEPLRSTTGESNGVLVGIVDPAPLVQRLLASPGHDKTRRTYLVNKDGLLVTVTQGEHAPVSGDSSVDSFAFDRTIAGNSGRATYRSIDGTSVFGVYRWLPEFQIGLIVERDVASSFAPVFMDFVITAVVALISITLTVLLARQMTKRIAQPITRLAIAAQQMIAGNLDQSVEIERTDEIGVLGQAFNQVATHLRTKIEVLETTIQERTTQMQEASTPLQRRTVHLEATTEIGRAVTATLDPVKAMQTTVDLFRDRFGFSNVSLFLLDETGDWAVVRASTGEIGRQLIMQHHRLRVSGTSLVAWVCTHRKPRVAFDIGEDAVHFDHPSGPRTRSELVLPLLTGQRLLGALDVRSTQEAAFKPDDVLAFQEMADLVAIALRNALVFEETRKTAHHQQMIGRVLERLQFADSVADILTTTLEELGGGLNLAEATVVLDPNGELSIARNGGTDSAVSASQERR